MSLEKSLCAAKTAFLAACKHSNYFGVFKADIVIRKIFHDGICNVAARKVVVCAVNVARRVGKLIKRCKARHKSKLAEGKSLFKLYILRGERNGS